MRSTAVSGTNSAISMALVAFSSSALISSAEKRTYWPLANSYPLPTSSFSTTVPSFEQMYCCLSRAPHVVCSMLKLTLAEDSLEEKRLTGTETSPNEIVADPMDLAAIFLWGWVWGLDIPAESGHRKSTLRRESSRLCGSDLSSSRRCCYHRPPGRPTGRLPRCGRPPREAARLASLG